ncbi:MAG: CRTAC1 family protein [Thermoanaerobaculia bacterium]
MTDRILRFVRRRRLLSGVVSTAFLLVPAAWMAGWAAERQGLAFYEAGQAAVASLAELAQALEARDSRRIEAAFAPDFDGSALGLPGTGELRPVSRRDGVVLSRFEPPGAATDRQGAIEEWWRYLEGFGEIETVELHVQRLESWDQEVVATARFEVIGTPRGAPRAGIDRGLLRVRFAPGEAAGAGGEGRYLGIRSLQLLEGERQIAERPLFAEVGEAAGIAFENRYYPPFLSEPLEFGMIRHGPAGITAADYDEDGLLDLFIPDGVSSRLYRNRGDGTFEDVTEAAGLAGLSGVSVALFADFDGDGWKDLFVSRTFEPNQLFRSNGPPSGPAPDRSPGGAQGSGPEANPAGVTFTDVTPRSGIAPDCCTTVASVGDYDLDGDLDLYVGRYIDPRERIPTSFYARNGEPNRLYRNEGDFRFTDVTEEAGVGDTGLCLGSAFADYDDDGWPDLWVANDFGRKTLYRNLGSGSGAGSGAGPGAERGGGPDGVAFEDVTVESGTLAYGAGMSSTVGDYDNDGLLDLYVAHIRSEHAWFAEAPTVRRHIVSVLRHGAWSALPLYFEVFRQSGPDFVEVFQQTASGNTLLRNRGDGTFQDTTRAARANPPGWFWGTSFADFDNDGWLDLYAANGWVYGEPGTELELEFLNDVVGRQDLYQAGALFDPARFDGRSWHGWERNRHLRNDGPAGGDGEVTFTEIGRAAGTDLLLNSRGIAVGDFWNRGVLDVAVAASADRHALLANRAGGGVSGRRWLQVEVAGAGDALPRGTNRDGVGARIVLEAGGLTQTREVILGDGYGSQNALRQHFGLGGGLGRGLGDARRVERLSVTWPRSGRVQTFRDVATNRIVRVTEGRDELEVVEHPSAEPPLAEAPVVQPRVEAPETPDGGGEAPRAGAPRSGRGATR